MSLDGVVESPEKWQIPYFDDEMGAEIGSQMAACDTLLLGRRTYEEFAAFWPQQGSDAGPAGFMNNTPKVVVSTTLDTVEWQSSTLLQGDVANAVSDLRAQPGKDVLVTGSITLVRSLLLYGLLDELSVMVCPVLVGSGKHLFEDGGHSVPRALVDCNPFASGVLSLTYQPAGGRPGEPRKESRR
jgi:dihydrofolate reductase